MDYEDFKRYWRNCYIGIPNTKGDVQPFLVENIHAAHVTGTLILNKTGKSRAMEAPWTEFDKGEVMFKPPTPGMLNDGLGVMHITNKPMRQWRKGTTVGNGRVHAHSPYTGDFKKATGFKSWGVTSPKIMWVFYNPMYFEIPKLEQMLHRGTRFGGSVSSTIALIMTEDTPHTVVLYKQTRVGELRDGVIHLYHRMMPYADHIVRELGLEVRIDE